MVDHQVPEVDVLLHEYDSLRQESLDSMTNRSQIVAFGIGSLGAIFGGSLAFQSGSDNFLVAVFVGVIPAIAILVLGIWFGEVNRMMRAGAYLVELEKRVNIACGGKQLLGWEQFLRTGNQMRYPYIAVLAMFLGTAAGSPLIAYLLVQELHRGHVLAGLVSASITAVSTLAIWSYKNQLR